MSIGGEGMSIGGSARLGSRSFDETLVANSVIVDRLIVARRLAEGNKTRSRFLRQGRFVGRRARTGDAGLEGGGSAHEGGGAGLGTGRLGGDDGAGHGVHGDDGHGDDLFVF